MRSQEWVFKKIKEKFKKKLILVHFDYEKSVIINADASEKAMKAWLQQINDQKWKQLITCYTWKLTFIKQQYDIHDKEMLAIVKA